MNANIETKEINLIQIEKIEITKKIYRVIKRCIDIVGSLVGCIMLVPLTFGIWIANILTKNNGPTFYVQKRIGKDGKTFRMYKYRSMEVNADKKLNGYLLNNLEAKTEFEKFKKLKEDPRVTKVGKVIRRTSLDEFPQFINVLKGDMSLVGPRPYLVREKRQMEEAYKDIIRVKPGITGLWQIGGRNNITFKDRMEIEKKYVRIANLKLDIKILKDTVINAFNSKEQGD